MSQSAKQSSETDGVGRGKHQLLTSAQMEKLATRMAHKTYEGNLQDDLTKTPALRGPTKIHARIAAKKDNKGRAHQVTSATIHYVGDFTKTGLRSECAIDADHRFLLTFGSTRSFLL